MYYIMKTETLFIQGLNREITFHIGQHKSDNFDVIDLGNPDDLWFHVLTESSCHVVAIIPENINKKDRRYIIKVGAHLCKKYTSKLNRANNVEIVFTEIKNVEKTECVGCVKIKSGKTIIV